MTPRLVLFDIDGTLVLTGGAGKRALSRAFQEVFGVADGFSAVMMAGRTDRFLVEREFERHGLPATNQLLTRFRDRYIERLAEAIVEPGEGTKAMMPGVAPLLDALEALDQVHSALLTGNYEAGAKVKLGHFRLWHRFAWGAFGDKYADRNDLARAAIAVAPANGVSLRDPAHAVVIGDTPFDVECARAAGARVVAVATGGHGVDELRACQPDLVLEDLRDVGPVVDFITSA